MAISCWFAMAMTSGSFFEPPELQLLYGLLPSVWSRGYATEAARAVMRHALDDLGFDEIRAATDVPNHASVRVLERLGLREWKRSEDGPRGTVFFRAVREALLGETGEN